VVVPIVNRFVEKEYLNDPNINAFNFLNISRKNFYYKGKIEGRS